MKFTVTVFFLVCIVTMECSAQSDYDQICIDSIVFEGTSLSNIQGILKEIGDKVPKKIYIPPDGDTDEYDKIHYYENEVIMLKLYESSGNLSLSSITTKTNRYQFRILRASLKVGSTELMLSKFQKSYDRFTKLKSNAKVNKENEFHLYIICPNRAQGILTIKIKDKLVTEINISLDPA